MFRHCEAPGFLPLADTNILLAASRLDGFSTFLFRTLSVRQTIEIRRDRKPNGNVSQVAIQVGVPTGNKAARRAHVMVIKHLLTSVQFTLHRVWCISFQLCSQFQFTCTRRAQAMLLSQYTPCLWSEHISCVCTLIIKLQISDTRSIICFIT